MDRAEPACLVALYLARPQVQEPKPRHAQATLMRHLLFCREYPPVSGGGIGSYTARLATLLVERGETVHVVSQRWKGADKPLERLLDGRLLVHRVPCERPGWTPGLRAHRRLNSPTERALFGSPYFPQAFGWSAGLIAERLVEEEGIDVIEAPEYEAALYFFQLRRALGLGPDRKPPCVVHLHSPTEAIVRHNGWDMGHPYFLTAKRLEDFSMSAADALLSPSHYLANEISSRSDLKCADIRVIHYPAPAWEPRQKGSTPQPDGTIVYVGRLERRKGSIEWLDAAVATARSRPNARFEFVGAPVLDSDWRSGEDVVEDRVPPDVRDRFEFHGLRPAAEVRAILEGARLVVVPSRWDNFPNTCIEALIMGLPVLATRNGGMVQLVEDGRNGWLSASAGAADLHEALVRALDTPARELREMGRTASESVRERCAPGRIVDAHLDFKRELVEAGAGRSLRTPPSLAPDVGVPTATPDPPRASRDRVGAVIVCPLTTQPSRCLDALARQTTPPATTILVRYDPAHADAKVEPSSAEGTALAEVQRDRASAIRAGVAALAAASDPPEGIVVLDEHDVLYPHHIERCGQVLAHCPEVGLVSFWEGPVHAPVIRPCPTRHFQWLWNDAAHASVVRTVALERLNELPTLEDPSYDRWYLAGAALASGWVGVTVPEVLADRSTAEGWVPRLDSTHMVEAIQKPFQREISEDAPRLLLLTRSGFAGTLRDRAFRPREYSELAGLLAGDWRRAVRWGWKKVARGLGRG